MPEGALKIAFGTKRRVPSVLELLTRFSIGDAPVPQSGPVMVATSNPQGGPVAEESAEKPRKDDGESAEKPIPKGIAEFWFSFGDVP